MDLYNTSAILVERGVREGIEQRLRKRLHGSVLTPKLKNTPFSCLAVSTLYAGVVVVYEMYALGRENVILIDQNNTYAEYVYAPVRKPAFSSLTVYKLHTNSAAHHSQPCQSRRNTKKPRTPATRIHGFSLWWAKGDLNPHVPKDTGT